MSDQENLFDYLKRKDNPGKTTGEDKVAENKIPLGQAPVKNPDPFLQQAASVSSLEDWRVICLTCSRCGLRAGASGVVFGEGYSRAQIMFIGEGPGAEEDRQGRPFVGAAGRLLDKIINSVGLSRENVYIANIVKCRPPKNRTPQKEEMETCFPLLEKQIELIDPSILVLLGSVAAKTMIHPDLAITRARGSWHSWKGRLVMPTFHPAALLRDPGKKRPVWEDIQHVMARYEEFGEKEPKTHEKKDSPG